MSFTPAPDPAPRPGSAGPSGDRAEPDTGRERPAGLPLVAGFALGAGLGSWAWLRATRACARVAAELRAERTRLAAVLAQHPAEAADAATARPGFGDAQLAELWRRPFTGDPWPAALGGSVPGEPAPWMRYAAAAWPAAAGGAAGEAARVAAQLVALQQVTAALGSALTVEAIADLVVGRVAAVLGAAAGALAVVDPATGAVRVVRAAGEADTAGAADAARLDSPLADAARTGRPVYLATADAARARYPAVADAHARRGYDGAAALPCVAAGEVLGVVWLGFRGPCPLADGERALGETLAAQCAQALSRARLLAAQAEARAAAEASARHLARIQRLTERVSTALTTADVMRVVGEELAGAVAGASAAVYAARPTDGLLELASEFGRQEMCETDILLPGTLETEAAALAEEAVATQRLVIRATPALAPVATCVALPLGAGRGVVGAVVLELRPARALTSMEQDLLLAAGRVAAQGITRARLQSLREEERRRVARELHDEFGQTLTGLKLDLAFLGRRLAAQEAAGAAPGAPADDGASLAREVGTMAEQVDAAIDALRRIAAELRPGALDDLGLATALDWQTAEFERRTGVPCLLDVDLDAEVGEPVATAVFRVFQEALTNIARHARARGVHAWLTCRDGELRLRVRDDGVGIAPAAAARPGAMGLVGMRERAAALGGTLAVTALRGGGTEVLLTLPYVPSGAPPAEVRALNAAEPRTTSRADRTVELPA